MTFAFIESLMFFSIIIDNMRIFFREPVYIGMIKKIYGYFCDYTNM